MKTFLAAAAALAAVAALGFAGITLADNSGVARFGPWGFDLAGRDTTVSPGADFYAYANGTYLKQLVIPPDRSGYGSFAALAALSEDRVHDILEKAAHDPAASGDEARIGAFYRAYMDETRIDALGARPLQPDLARIRAAKTRPALAALMGRAAESFYGSLFDPAIGVDAKDPEHYAVYLSQAGLGLPDRDYYLEPSFAPQKAEYQAYVARMLTLARWPHARAEAKAVVDLETKIAQASWSRADRRDESKSYTPMTPAELAAAAPGFDWKAFFAAGGLGEVRKVIVRQNTAVPKIAAIFAHAPISTLQAWQAFTATDAAAPVLSKPFVDAQFEFRSKDLLGLQQLKPRWKRAGDAVSGNLGEAVGKAYVAAYFPPEAKAKMLELVGNVRTALAARMQRVSWMSDATKARALEKLSKLNVKVGYPATWRDYSALKITGDDLFGDVDRSAVFDWQRQVRRLNGPVDRGEWGITPQTVNAYYDPTLNEIVFPAAILQPPFFDPNGDMAVNYGAIGAVIGHEMTHGYDDQGRHFDGTGRLADWWAPDDDAKFRVQAQRLGEQYSALEPIPGAHIKGDQTMGENIADLGGVLLGLDAYHLYLAGQPAPVLDGLTGDQRVFLGWAQIWRGALRPDALRQQLVSDVHSPLSARVNGVVRNVDGWYDAWGIKPGDPLYLPPDQRVRIW
jgi:putative endopeptidase